MSEHDFLYALKEELPEGFAQELKAKLDALDEPARNTRMDNHRTFWTVAAASLVTVLLGVVLVVSRIPQLQTLVIAPPAPVPSFTQHDVITSANIDQLQPFATLGNGAILGIEMMPDGQHLLIAASTGLFLHDAANLNNNPQQITSEYFSRVDIDEQGLIYGLSEAPTLTDSSMPKTIVRWNAETGERRELLQLTGNIIYVGGMSVKPDGSQIMIETCVEVEPVENFGWQCNKHEFGWYDTATGELLALDTPRMDSAYGRYAIADDWSYIAYFLDVDETSEVEEYSIQLIDLTNRDMRTNPNFDTAEPYPGIVLIFTAVEPYARIYSGLNILKFSPDGQYLLIQPVGSVQYFTIYDVDALWNSPEPINFWRSDEAIRYRSLAYQEPLYSYTMSSDVQYVVAATHDNLIRFDLPQEPDLTLQFSAEANWKVGVPYQDVVFSDDGQIMYGVYAGNVVMAYDMATLDIVDSMTYYDSDFKQKYQFTEDGLQVAITSAYRGIPRIWTLNSDTPTSERFMPDDELQILSQFTLSPDGMTVAYQTRGYWQPDNPLWIQRLSDSSTKHQIDRNIQMYNLQFLSDGTLAGLRYGNNGFIRYLVDDIFTDVAEPQVDRLYIPGLGLNLATRFGTSRVAISPDSQWIVLERCKFDPECINHEFTIWSLESQSQMSVIRDDLSFSEYGSMAFSPDSQLFAFAYCRQSLSVLNLTASCDTGEVRIYTVESLITHEASSDSPPLESLLSLTGFEALPTNIAFNPIQQDDGSWLVAITEWNTRTQIWRIHPDGTNEVLRILDDVRQPVAFDPTGGLMFTTADTAQTEVWGVPLPQ